MELAGVGAQERAPGNECTDRAVLEKRRRDRWKMDQNLKPSKQAPAEANEGSTLPAPRAALRQWYRS